MRIILDECMPARLRRDLPGHQVQTVPRAGWAGIKNGKLLQLIAAARGAMGSLMAEVVEDQVRFHIVDPDAKPSSKQAQSAQQLIDVLKPYLR